MFEQVVNCISSDNETIEFFYYFFMLHYWKIKHPRTQDQQIMNIIVSVVKIYLFVFIFLYLFFIP